MHKTFATGKVTHVFAPGNKPILAIIFDESRDQKIIDPKVAQLIKID